MSDSGISHFIYTALAIRAISYMHRFREWIDIPKYVNDVASATIAITTITTSLTIKELPLSKDYTNKVKPIQNIVLTKGRKHIFEDEDYEIISTYGFSIHNTIFLADDYDYMKVSKEIDYLLTIKILSSDIIPKSDAGGVKTGLRNDNKIRTAIKTISDNAIK